jgi:Putative Zn-dependent protease, contains TPR repeats
MEKRKNNQNKGFQKQKAKDPLKEIQTLIFNREFDKANKGLDEHAKSNEITPYFLYLRGQCFMGNKKYDEALNEFKKALEKNPKGGNFHSVLGSCYAEVAEEQTPDSENYQAYQDLALKYLEEGLQRGANYKIYRSYNTIADIYVKKGNITKALENYEAAIKDEPDDWWAYNGLGVLYQKKKEYTKAIEHFTKALAKLSLKTDNGRSDERLMEFANVSSQIEARIEECRKALEENIPQVLITTDEINAMLNSITITKPEESKEEEPNPNASNPIIKPEKK